LKRKLKGEKLLTEISRLVANWLINVGIAEDASRYKNKKKSYVPEEIVLEEWSSAALNTDQWW
jgi:hypothetical protein